MSSTTHPPAAGPTQSPAGDGPELRLHPTERVEAVLRGLPSHGWTAGWIGRRDRALLVLSQLAGLSFGQIAGLTAGDLTVIDGVATISTAAGRTTLEAVDDDLLCGPCTLARWVHALDLTVVYPDGRVIAAVIARAVPLTPDSPHLCQSNNTITEITRSVTLLPPIDRWGHPHRAPALRRLPATRAVRDNWRHPAQADPDPLRARPREAGHRAVALASRAAQLLAD